MEKRLRAAEADTEVTKRAMAAVRYLTPKFKIPSTWRTHLRLCSFLEFPVFSTSQADSLRCPLPTPNSPYWFSQS
jgi:hypothetical protein